MDSPNSLPLTRWETFGMLALQAMWLVALFAPALLYMLPLWYSNNMPPHHHPGGNSCGNCFEMSVEPPHALSCILVAILGLSSLALPTVWHRRSLARLHGRVRARFGDDEVASEMWARAAIFRYAGRLASALAFGLPIYFVAHAEASIQKSCGIQGCIRFIPAAEVYLPLLAVLTIVTVAHAPTPGRVFGGFFLKNHT